MPYIEFSKHHRVDGGTRYTISVEFEPIFHQFEGGEDDDDPALEWYIDVRCRGHALPTDTHAVRQWFMVNSMPIKDGLQKLAATLAGGVSNQAEQLFYD